MDRARCSRSLQERCMPERHLLPLDSALKLGLRQRLNRGLSQACASDRDSSLPFGLFYQFQGLL